MKKASRRKTENKKTKDQFKKRRKKRSIKIDQVYRHLNRVQTDKKKAKFTVKDEIVDAVRNTIEDIDLEYKEEVFGDRVTFIVFPNKEVTYEDCENLDDKFFEDNFLY